MQRYILTLVATTGILGSFGGGCTTRTPSAAHTTASAQAPEASSRRQISEEERQKYYRDFGSVTWRVDDKGTLAEARIETAKVLLDALPEGFPVSRIVINNVTSGTTLFTEDLDSDFPLSMYTRNANGDAYDELILALSAGASANQLRILSVSATNVRELLAVQYRIEATLLDLDGRGMSVLVTPGFDRPYTTTLYVLKGDRFEPVGTASREKVVAAINRQFDSAAKPPPKGKR